MSNHNAGISIIIPNLHCPEIDRVLAALRSQAPAAGGLEILVVGLDRHGLVKEDDLVRFLSTGHPIPPAAARNLGAASSSGATLIFLDADCVPQPGWLPAMLEAQSEWPDAGAISGAMLPDGDTFRLVCGQIAGFHEHLNFHAPAHRRTLASFSLLVPRHLWEVLGGFNESFTSAAGEDLDFSIRLAHHGYSLGFEPRATVRHRPSRDSWHSMWLHAHSSGSWSILVRTNHAAYYGMPAWATSSWAWLLLSPAIALARTAQIYSAVPGLWRYWRCAPWVFASKIAWCWGAAGRLRQA